MTPLSGVGVCVTPEGGVGREADYFRGPFEVRTRWGYRGRRICCGSPVRWPGTQPGQSSLFKCRFRQLLSCWPGGNSESKLSLEAPAVSTPLISSNKCTVQFSLGYPIVYLHVKVSRLSLLRFVHHGGNRGSIGMIKHWRREMRTDC